MPIIIREQIFSATISDEPTEQTETSASPGEVDIQAIVELCTKKVLQKLKVKTER